jgi:hypothetical protein
MYFYILHTLSDKPMQKIKRVKAFKKISCYISSVTLNCL